MNRPVWAVPAAFALTGVATTMLGPLMPALESRWRLPDARAGLLFTAQFTAGVAAAALVGPLARRWGYFGLMTRGLALIAVGIVACALGTWPVVLVAVAIYGCGLGAAIPAANLGVAAVSGSGSAGALLRLNLIWSLGAIAAPVLVAGLGGIFLWSLAAAFACSALLVRRGGEGPRSVPAKPGQSVNALVWLTAIMLFLYVGTEASLSGWLSSYAVRMAARGIWAMAPSLFWTGILLGRAIAPGLLRRMPIGSLAALSLVCAFAATTLLVLSRGAGWLLAAAAIAGFGMAPIFPVVVAQYAGRKGGATVPGLVFAAASLGGAAIPALVGFISTGTGSLRTGLSVLLLWIAVMLWLQTRLTASERTTGA